ncbi:MAG: hypothetical protein HON04_00140 [Planctomicrobium sp.]|jgi:protein tyrosine phosphatase (PTP) superfamily phosphohydrolase (DUF442 family)|nr:hypothetical protein [Planctomicrobium sp.]
MRIHQCVRILLSLALLASLGSKTSVATEVFAAKKPKVLNTNHLPNAIQVHPKVISGGLPGNPKAFAELAMLGVQTIISVDGQKPDITTAKKFGMNYVHLPHGYNGISANRAQELAKAVRDLPGPIYIHCHHGKNRSPTAASVACVSAGMIDQKDALSILTTAGTSPHYEGLYDSAKAAAPIDPADLDQLEVDFKEQMPIAPLVESMVSIEETFANLKQFQKVNWRILKQHPDLEPTHEALLLKEHFRELSRLEDKEHTPDYLQILKSSEFAAEQLEADLRKWKSSDRKQSPSNEFMNSMLLLEKNCQKCHQKYRDIPLNNSLQK